MRTKGGLHNPGEFLGGETSTPTATPKGSAVAQSLAVANRMTLCISCSYRTSLGFHNVIGNKTIL